MSCLFYFDRRFHRLRRVSPRLKSFSQSNILTMAYNRRPLNRGLYGVFAFSFLIKILNYHLPNAWLFDRSLFFKFISKLCILPLLHFKLFLLKFSQVNLSTILYDISSKHDEVGVNRVLIMILLTFFPNGFNPISSCLIFDVIFGLLIHIFS